MGRIITRPRCVTDITGPDPLSLMELGGVIWKIRRNEGFVSYEQVIRCE